MEDSYLGGTSTDIVLSGDPDRSTDLESAAKVSSEKKEVSTENDTVSPADNGEGLDGIPTVSALETGTSSSASEDSIETSTTSSTTTTTTTDAPRYKYFRLNNYGDASQSITGEGCPASELLSSTTGPLNKVSALSSEVLPYFFF